MKKNEKAFTVAFTGGGGKTSLIFGLAEIFSGQGKRVIVTTTTHMAWEPERPFAEAEDIPGACPAYRTIRIRHRGLTTRPGSQRFPAPKRRSWKSCPAFVIFFLWKLTDPGADT